MTEYDYSPELYERYLAKQASIARWVDNTNEHTPSDPFHPLPDLPDEHGSPGPGPSYHNPAPTRTYSYHPSGNHNHRHSNFIANPRPTAPGLLPLGGLYRGATQAQVASPMNMTNAAIPPQNQWFPHSSSHFPSETNVDQPFASQSQFPYAQPSPQSPYLTNNIYSPPPYTSSSVQPLPPPRSALSYVQNPNQPVVVPLNGGGFVVLPPGQQVQVISESEQSESDYHSEGDHDTDSDSETVFVWKFGAG